MTIYTTKMSDLTIAQIIAMWEPARAKQIIALMNTGLPYFRAVRRSRRYYMEGKWA